MGTEPIEEEIPVDPSDFCQEAQQAFYIYHVLPDVVDGMSGIWYGKNFSGIGDIFKFYKIKEEREVFDYLSYMIQVSRNAYAKDREQQSKLKK